MAAQVRLDLAAADAELLRPLVLLEPVVGAGLDPVDADAHVGDHGGPAAAAVGVDGPGGVGLGHDEDGLVGVAFSAVAVRGGLHSVGRDVGCQQGGEGADESAEVHCVGLLSLRSAWGNTVAWC